ncbi:MAG TPA: DoxX family protein [Flavobacterium sp.]|uniref:DoxX family protein n=1 Tax=Flavobacterium sp. TaxID=239 RepID=UPI0028EB0014|nr:DoxX family protein [uncultured Flavobacterium sp.]
MKTKKIITLSLTVLTTAIIFLSGLMKFIHLPWSVAGLEKYNPTLLGLMEMAFIILFAVPKTMRMGFILLCCYFAGAMATELSRDASMLNPGIPLALIWITAFLRDSSIFISPSSLLAVKK